MELVILSIHLLVCVCLIGLVLLQRSEGGALGMGGGGGGSLMSGRGAADALARMTSVAGGFFLVTSLGLTMLSSAGSANAGRSVIDLIPEQSAPAATPAPQETAPAQPEPTRPDPTESRAPSNTQMVSLGPREAAASTPPAPSAAPTRAGPIEQRPAATQPRQATPATTQPAAAQRPAAAPTQRSGTASNPPATAPANAQRPAAAPATAANGAVNGIDLTTDTQNVPESSDPLVGAVRRERAGPDQ
jgi:preprotein translocase subunit SecG